MKYSPTILRYVVNVKLRVKIWSIFLVFLENINFIFNWHYSQAFGKS